MATEKRLIDANALLEIGRARKIIEVVGNWQELPGCAKSACVRLGTAHKKMILDAPTVDAVILPCKIGDKVYRIDKGNYHSNWKPFVEELTVTEISWKKEKYGDKDLGFAIIADGIRYKFTSIGKSVFLTRKEAEAKMDGERKDND